MRSFTAFLLFVYSFNVASAQTLIAEFPPIRPKTHIDNLLVAHEKGSPYGVCYATPSSIVVQMLDEAGKSIYQIESQQGNTVMVPQGILTQADTYQFVYFDDVPQDFVIVTAGKADESAANIQIMTPFEPKDKYLGSIVSNNELYCLAWSKAKQALRLGRYLKAENRISVKDIPVDDDLSDKLRKKGFSGLKLSKYGEPLFTAISNTTIPEPGMMLDRHKIYLLENGKIAITMEGTDYEKCQTELVLVDWENSSLELLKMGPPVLYDGFNFSTNSFIHNDRLAMFQVELEFFYLAIYDLDSMKMRKEYNYASTDTLGIMGSRLFTESEASSIFTDTKAYSKEQTAKVLKRMSRGKPFVYFEPNSDGDLAFTLGNTQEQGGGGGYSPGIPGSTISTPGGTVSMPGTPGSFHNYGSSYSLSRYFYTVLDKHSFDYKPGNPLDKQFLSKQIKGFVEQHLEGKGGGLFSTSPEYQIVNIPGADYALILSYLKKDGLIKLHKIAL